MEINLGDLEQISGEKTGYCKSEKQERQTGGEKNGTNNKPKVEEGNVPNIKEKQ